MSASAKFDRDLLLERVRSGMTDRKGVVVLGPVPHDTTNDFIMGGVAQTLDDESIQAIAAWLSSLTPAGSL